MSTLKDDQTGDETLRMRLQILSSNRYGHIDKQIADINFVLALFAQDKQAAVLAARIDELEWAIAFMQSDIGDVDKMRNRLATLQAAQQQQINERKG